MRLAEMSGKSSTVCPHILAFCRRVVTNALLQPCTEHSCSLAVVLGALQQNRGTKGQNATAEGPAELVESRCPRPFGRRCDGVRLYQHTLAPLLSQILSPADAGQTSPVLTLVMLCSNIDLNSLLHGLVLWEGAFPVWLSLSLLCGLGVIQLGMWPPAS